MGKKTDSEVVRFRIKTSTKEVIQEAAYADGRTLSNMVGRILDTWVTNNTRDEAGKPGTERGY